MKARWLALLALALALVGLFALASTRLPKSVLTPIPTETEEGKNTEMPSPTLPSLLDSPEFRADQGEEDPVNKRLKALGFAPKDQVHQVSAKS
ncbi:MAG: hypothetical protein WDZ85_01515 [Candidatus Paceibacterota bacterium]